MPSSLGKSAATAVLMLVSLAAARLADTSSLSIFFCGFYQSLPVFVPINRKSIGFSTSRPAESALDCRFSRWISEISAILPHSKVMFSAEMTSHLRGRGCGYHLPTCDHVSAYFSKVYYLNIHTAATQEAKKVCIWGTEASVNRWLIKPNTSYQYVWVLTDV